MKAFFHFLSKEKSLAWIIVFGAVLRLLFVFIGGRIYYGRSDFFIQGDTLSWFQAFINLCEHGIFTTNVHLEAGKFFRPPGYSFLFGIFYLISFKNFALAWKLLVAAQIIMDTASIYIISRIATNVVACSSSEKKITFSNLSALLFAVYPFVIVWAPVLYAETASIFFVLLSIHFAFIRFSIRNSFLSGLFGGIATLLRLQCAFCILFLGIIFFLSGSTTLREKIRSSMIFCFALLITYGLWPARNFFLQHRILFSEDLNIGRHWSRDFVSFLDFSHSVSTDHIPVYREIIENKKVNWPAQAYLDPDDSLLLDSAVNLCRTCGTGFAYWKEWEHLASGVELQTTACDTMIDKIFTSLYQKQKTKNVFNYWVAVPLSNLKKCFFKFSLYGNKSAAIKLFSGMLFIFRTVFVLLGLFGIYLAFRSNFLQRKFLLFVLTYMMVWYFYISVFHRNIEIRFLLHTDVLLLIPAAYVFVILFSKRNPTET